MQTVVGFVQSVADHGYAISFGIGEVAGFLKKADAAAYSQKVNSGSPLRVGQLLDCSIMAAPKGRTVAIAVNPETFAKSVVCPFALSLSVPLSLLCLQVLNSFVPSGVFLASLGELEAWNARQCHL